MKELTLYGIRDAAIQSGRAVYSVQQLSNLIGKSRSVAAVYLSRLVGKGLARRLIKGRISFVYDDLVIATQLVEPSYVSLNSALLFHGIITQVQRDVESVTPRNTLSYRNLGLAYHKIPGHLFFGYKSHQRGGSYAFIAEPEKALIDGIYLNLYSKKDLEEHMASLDRARLKELAVRFTGRGSRSLERMIK